MCHLLLFLLIVMPVAAQQTLIVDRQGGPMQLSQGERKYCSKLHQIWTYQK
jgi:hypothetical protein